MTQNKEQEKQAFQNDLGILFVHGIGQQEQGDTLVRFGEPVQQWLQRWLSQKSEPNDLSIAEIKEARFSPADPDDPTPAHAILQINGTDHNGAYSSQWFMAESWWANTFLSPRFQDIVTWGFKILPWSLSTHFATRARRVWLKYGEVHNLKKLGVGLRLILEIAGFLLALSLFPVLVSLLMLILIIGALPIPRIRAFAAQLQQMLARTLGDSYVLIASPIQEAVIVGKVEEDLNWLLGQGCRRIAVVAHSQGAAVAHAALKNVLSERDEELVFSEDDSTHILFVSLGSGLNKLSEIRHIRGKSNPKTVWLAPAGFLLAALSLPEVISSIRFDEFNFFSGMFAALGIGLLVPGINQALEQFRPEPKALKFKSKWGVKWLDFYSSADPVPNGPMYDSAAQTQELMHARKINNKASMFLDHTSYWQNEDEFLGQLVGALCGLAGISYDRKDSQDLSYLAVAGPRRKWRIGWLFVMRLSITFLTIALIGSNWEVLASLTDRSMEILSSLIGRIPLIAGLFSLVDLGDDVSQLVSVSIVVFMGSMAYLMLYGAWSVWNRTDIVALIERTAYKPLGSSFIVFLFLSVVIIEAFLLAIWGHGGGIVPGLIAAVGAWIMLFFLFGLVFGGLYFALDFALKNVISAFQTIKKYVWKKADAEQGRKQADLGQTDESRPIDWRDDTYRNRRIWISFFVLIMLTFPFIGVVASSMTADELWGDRNIWEYIFENPEELVTTIERQTKDFPIRLWEWISGIFILVICWNVIGITGGFNRIHRWFIKTAQAEPIAVAHARHLQPEEAKIILLEGIDAIFEQMGMLENKIQDLGTAKNHIPDDESGLDKKLEDTIEKRKDAFAKQLRAMARDAYLMVQQLSATEAEDLLKNLSPIHPEAAIEWAKRYGHEKPEDAKRLLALHADQPGWELRRRIQKELKKYKQFATLKAEKV